MRSSFNFRSFSTPSNKRWSRRWAAASERKRAVSSGSFLIIRIIIALNVQKSTCWRSLVTDPNPTLGPPADYINQGVLDLRPCYGGFRKFATRAYGRSNFFWLVSINYSSRGRPCVSNATGACARWRYADAVLRHPLGPASRNSPARCSANWTSRRAAFNTLSELTQKSPPSPS